PVARPAAVHGGAMDDHDVGMADAREPARFLEETSRARTGRSRFGAPELERDLSPATRLGGQVHGTEAASPDQSMNVEMSPAEERRLAGRPTRRARTGRVGIEFAIGIELGVDRTEGVVQRLQLAQAQQRRTE